MAKEKEQKLARVLYVNEGKTAKEIAAIVNVTEKTLGAWVDKFGWKEQREAMANAPDKLVKNLKELINTLTEQRLELERQKHYDDDEAKAKAAKDKARLADEISKWTKALDAANKETDIPLATYIRVMEQLFADMQKKHPKIYMQLVDFQEDHINELASRL